ncbi:hypothetical protein L198_02830 [Cryptococcus wingfieldii CBS 7118]|uniref:DUF4211 domain-containing protein n=1 Tax=Cryptococcus wingfieldii CBS 7118 TaxID=1295528 RepID=A0A1E3JMJ6_9TREE|nr:hypothetical protein L198_02830 [Cryptococcus wingfieldii CBS 7118]ODO02099.1 hypothetical protein L198_02830 [Cryptococcus wingfieldii CBS 7118]
MTSPSSDTQKIPPQPQALRDSFVTPSVGGLLDDGSDVQELAQMSLANRRQGFIGKRRQRKVVASSGDEDDVLVHNPSSKRQIVTARAAYSSKASRLDVTHRASSSHSSTSFNKRRSGQFDDLLFSADERHASPVPPTANSRSRVRKAIAPSTQAALNGLKERRARRGPRTPTRSSDFPDDRPGRLVIVSDNERSLSPPRTSRRRRSSGRAKPATQVHLDPDDESTREAETEEEEDMLEGLKLDNPEDYRVEGRLRLGVIEVSSSSEGGGEESDSAEEYFGDDLLPDGTVRDPFRTEEDEMRDFITDDGHDSASYELPAEFAGARGQSEDTRFRIVFQYFLYLAMHGPERARNLPEREKAYFEPFLSSMRTRMTDYRNNRVRSQAWRQEFVHKLLKYPYFCAQFVKPEPGCDACNLSGRISSFAMSLEGRPYDSVTFEYVTDSDDDSESSNAEEDDEWDELEKLRGTNKGKDSPQGKIAREKSQMMEHLRVDYEWLEHGEGMDNGEAGEAEEVEQRNVDSYIIGKYCKRRAQIFHRISHWEFILFHRIKQLYTDLLTRMGYKVPGSLSEDRAKKYAAEHDDYYLGRRNTRQRTMADRAAVLRGSDFPEDCEDLESVLQWMIGERYVSEQQEWIENLIERAENLDKIPSDR